MNSIIPNDILLFIKIRSYQSKTSSSTVPPIPKAIATILVAIQVLIGQKPEKSIKCSTKYTNCLYSFKIKKT
jgi:hypothetical protein